MHNILTEPLIRMVKSDGSQVEPWSLPEVYAALMADQVEAFPALRPHQRHAWHAFLVQLGAMAMHRVGLSEPQENPETWQRIIRGLTPDFPNDEPWRLVVEDITKPAFMQPPARSKEREADYKNPVATPDELDMLVTSRNHDLKSAVAIQSRVDDWIFSLVSLQTMGGYSKAGTKASYYSISRVKSASSSRVAFSLTPSPRLGPHVRRDITALLEMRPAMLKDYDYEFADSGLGLVWTDPWDGEVELNISALDIFYIEICRRIRLYIDKDHGIYGKRVGSQKARINAKDYKGRVADPWIPISQIANQEEALELTKREGFNYKQITDCLNPSKYKLPPIFLTNAEQRSSTDMSLVARGIVSYARAREKRGSSGTETRGYEERVIPLRLRALQIFGRAGGPEMLGEIAKHRVEQIGKVQEALEKAISIFPLKKLDIEPWTNQLDEIVDRSFFEDLQDEFESEDLEERNRRRDKWLMNGKSGVVDHARRILADVIDSLPCQPLLRYKFRVQAEDRFEDEIRVIGLPKLFQRSDNEEDTE